MANFASFASATTAGGGSQDELSKLLADFGDAGDFVTGDDDDVNIGADQGQDWEDDDLDAELAAEDAAEAARQGGQPLNPLEAAAAQVQLLARTEEDDAMDDVRHFIKREPSSDEDDEDGEDDYEDDSIAEVEPATQGIDPALLAAFPSFKPGAILDFTDLMAMPPKKRPKLDVRPAKGAQPVCSMSRVVC